jgi:cytochrome c553
MNCDGAGNVAKRTRNAAPPPITAVGFCQGESVRFGAIFGSAELGIMRSRVRSAVLVAFLASTAFASAAAFAQTPGDAAKGKALANTCLGCHGVPGYKNAYPNYSVPKLEGQHPEYIVLALQAYRSGERSHITMHSQASSLSDEDMANIAAYFSGEVVSKDNNPPEGKPPEAAAVCVACHGENGVGITGVYPTLAGQHADYLERTLIDYRKGGRKNAIMGTFAQQIKEEDIRVLARFYAKQKPTLETEARPSSILTAGTEK